MKLSPRWIITVSFYVTTLVVLLASSKDDPMRQFYIEPLLLAECFVILGLVTSDFLIPSLSRISRDILHISDRISGMTLLALGNAIPDISSTYQSMTAGATSLAVGELLGGIFFLITIVLGSMCFIRTIDLSPVDNSKDEDFIASDVEGQNDKREAEPCIKYDRWQFFQDIIVFFSMIFISLAFLADGKLAFWECIVMVLTYSAYVAYLLVQYKSPYNVCADIASFHNDVDNGLLGSDLTTIMSNSDLIPNDQDNIIIFNEGISARRDAIKQRIRGYLRSNYHGWVKMTLKDCLDIWENQHLLDQDSISTENNEDDEVEHDEIASRDIEEVPEQNLRSTTSLQESRLMKKMPSFVVEGDHLNPHTSKDGEVTVQNPNQEEYSSLLQLSKRPLTRKSLSCDHIPGIANGYDSITPAAGEENMYTSIVQETSTRWPSRFKLYDYLMDSSMEISISEFTALLFMTPASIVLHTFIPLQNPRAHDQQLEMLEFIQVISSPFLIWYLLTESITYWAIILTLVCCAVLLYRWKYCIIRYNLDIISISGFLLSLGAISYTVHIVVGTLTDWTQKHNISQTILGLTVFAWGNSIGDLVSNMTFMKIGVLEIALGACLGSPLLYFLFGVGVDGILIMLQRERNGSLISIFSEFIDFTVDGHLKYSGVGIFLTFVIIVIAVPMNNWRMDKRVSALLFLTYFVITGLNVFVEIK